jgi:glyoxylase-like metal-dependent hydrolase (beta-lactamase superfamily II)
MTSVEVAPGVHRITRGVTNFYVVEDRGRLTLVDAGTPKDWDAFIAAIGSLGRTIRDLDAVVLTHAHSDHVGFAERARTTAHATVRVHELDEAVATGAEPPKNEGSMMRYLLRPAFYRTALSLLRRGAGKIVPVVEVSSFGDGEALDVPGSPRAVHAPGHTAGCCALFLEDRKALLSGDVLATWNALTGRDGPQIMPSGLNVDSDQALSSLSALEAIEADVVLPGHGEPWTEGVPEALRRARAAGRS